MTRPAILRTIVPAIVGFGAAAIAFHALDARIQVPSPIVVTVVAVAAMALVLLPLVTARANAAREHAPTEPTVKVSPSPPLSLDAWIAALDGRDKHSIGFELDYQVIRPTPPGLTPALLEALCSPADLIRPRLEEMRKLDGQPGEMALLERKAAEWHKVNPPENASFVRHHVNEAPMLLEAFILARMRSDVTCRDLDFVATKDRRLWYAFQNVGRKAVFLEGAGLVEHVNTSMAQPVRGRESRIKAHTNRTFDAIVALAIPDRKVECPAGPDGSADPEPHA
jgi:hypothetical protein